MTGRAAPSAPVVSRASNSVPSLSCVTSVSDRVRRPGSGGSHAAGVRVTDVVSDIHPPSLVAGVGLRPGVGAGGAAHGTAPSPRRPSQIELNAAARSPAHAEYLTA